MILDYSNLATISEKYGDAFYLLDTNKLRRNYFDLLDAFRNIYSNSHIAYSYKTNYTPKICKTIDQLKGIAEVVSSMEFDLALAIGVQPKNIIFNGPYKDKVTIERTLLGGGIVQIDSSHDVNLIKKIAKENSNRELSIGLRLNFDLQIPLISRFGLDTTSEYFKKVVKELNSFKNLKIRGIHCHFPNRDLNSYSIRTENMLNLSTKIFDSPPEYINIGGGYFGRMPETLKSQFNCYVPEYKDYAQIIAAKFNSFYNNVDMSKRPKLIIEPGSALVADIMQFVAKVISIKNVRGRNIATTAGSIYNISPTSKDKNMPMSVVSPIDEECEMHDNIFDIAGYTCIESDYLYHGFKGKISHNDFLVFSNVGSYSIVMKPPFILPNYAILEYSEDDDQIQVIKRRETFKDIFNSFNF